MELKNYFTQDTYGNRLQYADCTIYLEGTTTPATGIVDINGQPLSNPVSSGPTGLIQFAAPNGRYDLVITKGALTYTIQIQCNDVSDTIGVVEEVRDSAEALAIDALNYVAQTQTLTIQAQQAALDAEDVVDTAMTSLGDSVDPAKGAGLTGWSRKPMSEFSIDTVASILGTSWVNVWEFTHLITVRPSSSNPSTWDWTPAIAGAQAKALALSSVSYGGYGVKFTAGIFPVTRIFHYSGTPLRGMGSANTFITALPFDPDDGKPYGMLELAPGVIQGAHITGIAFCGSSQAIYGYGVVNPNQWGFYCHAQYNTAFTQGGFWHSQLIDLVFWNFNKGIWSRAGYTHANSRLPNQWIDFIGVRVVVQDGGQPWLFTGQHGQIHVQGGHGEAISATPAKRALYSVKITYDPDPSTTAINGVNGESTSDVAGVGNALRAGHNITFNNGYSFQRSQKGLWVDGPVRNITVTNCWFETLAQAVTAAGDCNVSLIGNRFANAGIGTTAGGAAGTGYILTLGANGQIDYGTGNIVEGSYDHFISDTSSGANECNGFNFVGCLRSDATGSVIIPTLPQKSPAMDANGKIDMGSHRFATVASNADKTIRLSQISSNLLPGQTLVLRAASGSVTLKNSAGGNIITGSGKDITIQSGGIATLLRIVPYVTGSEFLLQSVSTHYASAVPADGFYYTQGHIVYNIATAAGVPAGWICTTAGLAGTTAVFKAMANLV